MITVHKSFLLDFPHLKEEWHTEKNKDLNPSTISYGSDIRAWWICEKGHEWEARITKRTTKRQGCPVCSNRKLHDDNCLLTVNPKVAKEWHPIKNGLLTPSDVIHNQHIKVWWKCEKEHEWQSSVRYRNRGSNCHYCTKQKTLKKDSIAVLRPDLMKEWHTEKNKTINPETVPLNSTKVVWWKCVNGHEWKKEVTYRTKEKELSCPACKSIHYLRPDIAKEWHIVKNTCSPFDVSIGSSKLVWWKCEKGHEWKERVNFRTTKEDITCKTCSSIVYTHPHLVKEWDSKKNKCMPDEVTKGSGIKAWWNCEFGHSWKATVAHRALRNQGCPTCSPSQTSFPEQYITYALSTVFKDVKNREKIDNEEVDIWIPSLSIAIEYDGVKWHKDRKEKEMNKNKALIKNGLKVIRIREEGLEVLPDVQNFFISFRPTEEDLMNVCQTIISYLSSLTQKKYILEQNNVSVVDVLEYIRFSKRKNSIESTHPHLVEEWDYIKNKTLLPVHFTHGSQQKTWWKCENGHSWKKEISKRSGGEGCPYCTGRRPDETNNLLVQFPKIAKEWHKEKNRISPMDVTPKSSKKVWWQCVKGHEWNAVISSRTNNHNGCPYCSGYKVSEQYNLEVINPSLALEWHPTKNKPLQPKDVTPGSSKIVWWRCQKGHEWENQVANRNGDGRGCPYCAGRKLTRERTLQIANPVLALDWHMTKNNDLTAMDVSTHSSKKVWWQCAKGHEWEATVGNRSNGRGCPTCYKMRRKKC